MKTFFSAVVIFFSLASSCGAEVVKCTTADGKVEYTDGVCASGIGRAISVNQNTLASSAVRELASKDETEQRTQLHSEAGAPILGRTESDLAAEKAGTVECARAKRNYEVAASSIQRNRNTAADELAMYSACGIKPPDKTVYKLRNGVVHHGHRPHP